MRIGVLGITFKYRLSAGFLTEVKVTGIAVRVTVLASPGLAGE